MDRVKLVLPLIALSLIACGNKKIVGYKDNYIERKIYESENDSEERLTTILTTKYNKKNLPEECTETIYSKEEGSNNNPMRKRVVTYEYDKKWRLIKESRKTFDITADDTLLESTITTYTYDRNTTITNTINNVIEVNITVEVEKKVTVAKIGSGKNIETTLHKKRSKNGAVVGQTTETKTEIFDKFNREIESHLFVVEDGGGDHSETTEETIVTFENAGDNYISKSKVSIVANDESAKSSSQKEIGKFEKSESMSNSEIIRYVYKDSEFETLSSGNKEIISKDSKNNTETSKSYSLDLNDNFNNEENWVQRRESFSTFTFDSKAYDAMTSKTLTSFDFDENGNKIKNNFIDSTYTNDEYGRCTKNCNTNIVYGIDGETITYKYYSREESKYDKPIPVYKK